MRKEGPKGKKKSNIHYCTRVMEEILDIMGARPSYILEKRSLFHPSIIVTMLIMEERARIGNYICGRFTGRKDIHVNKGIYLKRFYRNLQHFTIPTIQCFLLMLLGVDSVQVAY